MNSSPLVRLVALLVVVVLSVSSHARANDNSASLSDVHSILLEAAGDSPDTMPAADKQKDLLTDALKKIRHIPHVYHGQLNQAARNIEAAMDELSHGDAGHKARHDILDSADIIKGLMDQ